MNKQEMEVKILEIDVQKVLTILKQIGATRVFNGNISSEFFKNSAGLKLRLRRMSGENILTFKRTYPNSEVVHNEEIEVSFDNYEGMKQLLSVLGFLEYGSSQKKRISYIYQDIRFELDTLPGVPTFLEIESTSQEKVRNGVEILGYTMTQTSTFTERTIKEHYGIK